GLASPAPAEWAAPAVASAVDIALWDLAGKVAGKPIHRLIGTAHERVSAYASGCLYRDGQTPDSVAAEARSYVERGFTMVKMKIGALTLAEAFARVAAVRRAVGADVAIIVDAVCRLDRASAPLWCGELAALGVAVIQAPLPFADIEGMAALNRAGPLP